MKKAILFLMLAVIFNSCTELKEFRFSNFESTPVWELAKAVKDDDAELIKELTKANKTDIDYKDPIYGQTLLTLAIVNEKKEAFMALLNSGADPNIISGKRHDSSPLTESIIHQRDCDLFYVEYLLKHGANPNLEIIPNDKYYFSNYYPLFTAIIHNTINAKEDCVDLIRLLVDNGADINCCSPRPIDQSRDGTFCQGVINQCLNSSSMENLRYFVIEKKIKTPKVAYITGGSNKATQQEYSLTEILNTDDYRFEDFEGDNGTVDQSKPRKIRNEILEYLKKTGQK